VVNVSTSGIGGTDHMAAALLHSLTDTKVVFIHHKAPSGRLVDVMANRVHATTVSVVSGAPQIKAGKFRALAVAAAQRSTHLPDLPSIAEQGVPDYDFSSWVGLFATAKTPPAIINKLNTMFVTAIKSPAVSEKIEKGGSVIVGSSPEDLRKYVASETARWRKVVEENNLKPED
jgi:tripartite-type tricarboxylate transporter receptor subunit TctC